MANILEHPEQDELNEKAASIWRLPIVRALRRFSNCMSIRLLQGHYGGKTPKPTRLLFTNVTPKLEEIIARGLVAYRMMGEVFERSLPVAGTKILPAEFDAFVTNLVASFDYDAAQGQDFNPATAWNV